MKPTILSIRKKMKFKLKLKKQIFFHIVNRIDITKLPIQHYFIKFAIDIWKHRSQHYFL